MPGVSANDELAAYLRELKDRTGRSYDALARRLGVSRSALHRYCSGDGAPPQFTVLERFARECGASPEELTALHQRWTRAQEAQPQRQTGRQPASSSPEVPRSSRVTPTRG